MLRHIYNVCAGFHIMRDSEALEVHGVLMLIVDALCHLQ